MKKCQYCKNRIKASFERRQDEGCFSCEHAKGVLKSVSCLLKWSRGERFAKKSLDYWFQDIEYLLTDILND